MNAHLFHWVVLTLSRDDSVSQSERDVMMAIASELATHDDTMIGSVPRLSKLAKVSERTFQNMVNGYVAKGTKRPGLVERGYLVSEDRGSDANGKHRANRYSLGRTLTTELAKSKGRYRIDTGATVAPVQQLQRYIEVEDKKENRTDTGDIHNDTTGAMVAPPPAPWAKQNALDRSKTYLEAHGIHVPTN